MSNKSPENKTANASLKNGFGLGWPFIGLCLALLISTWQLEPMMNALGRALVKKPVPWPAGVVINPKTFQNDSLPLEIGPFKIVGDGMIPDRNQKITKDGKPDGIMEIKKQVLDSLGIGTPLDKIRIKDRESGWYLKRIYEDTRPGSNIQFWQIDITYYTGTADKVPHVAEVCGSSEGNAIAYKQDDKITLKGLPAPWDQFVLRHVELENKKSGKRSTVFYFFDVNGNPATNRYDVRGQLANPFNEYVFFAKVSFNPYLREGADRPGKSEYKKAAVEFLQQTLPAILTQLPDKKAIQQLKNGRK